MRKVFPDSDGKAIGVGRCEKCLCYTRLEDAPAKADTSETLRIQTAFHECWWQSETQSNMEQVAEDLRSVVRFCEERGFLDKSNRPTQNVFELGAGRGCLLRALRNAGYPARGSDPAKLLVQSGHKHFGFDSDVYAHETAAESVEKLKLSGCKLDAIFLWHVLEHISEPLQLIRSLHEILNTNGVVIAQVPLLDSRYLYPEHLFLFSRPSAERVAFFCSYICIYANVDCPTNFLTFVMRKESPSPNRK
jgi:2-polyprenyl-3-methyl-5-hydroxy-6-metoxy-1,4-benzoquinol methylase